MIHGPSRRAVRWGSPTVAVAGLALLLAGCTPGQAEPETSPETRNEAGEITEGGTTDVFALAVGDCLDDAALAGQQATAEIATVPTVPCADPHDFEVYLNQTVPEAETYPGEEAVVAQADSACLAAFDAYVGRGFEESALNFTFYYPSAETWEAEDRTITCLLTDPGVRTSGSLAGSAR